MEAGTLGEAILHMSITVYKSKEHHGVGLILEKYFPPIESVF